MKCKNCGAELPEGTLICSRCGVRQRLAKQQNRITQKKKPQNQ